MRLAPSLARAVVALAMAAGTFTSTTARAESAATSPPARDPAPDPHFPGGGRFSASIATGIPFVLMSELAVSPHDRFTVGAIGGIALSGDGPPNNTGFGIRPRVSLVERGPVRVFAVAPVLYYPKSNSSWFLARPEVAVEGRLPGGARIGGGLGLVAVASRASFTGGADGQPFLPYGGTPGQTRGDATNGVWNMVSVHGAVPISTRTVAHAHGALVLRGYALPGDEWVGGVPFTATLGLTTIL